MTRTNDEAANNVMSQLDQQTHNNLISRSTYNGARGGHWVQCLISSSHEDMLNMPKKYRLLL